MPLFVENIAAAYDALGPEKVGLIWGIGITNWESADQRDQFLKTITSKPQAEG